MNSTVVSGVFVLIGTALGWALSEVGAGWRGLTERRRAAQAEATARVLDAARIAVGFGGGVRWLVQNDVVKKVHGEGIGREAYGAAAIGLVDQLQQLRLSQLAIRAHGPSAAMPQISKLAARAEQLWNEFAATSRAEIADDPARFDRACGEITAIAQELVADGPSKADPARRPLRGGP